VVGVLGTRYITPAAMGLSESVTLAIHRGSLAGCEEPRVLRRGEDMAIRTMEADWRRALRRGELRCPYPLPGVAMLP
jgi:hypothetical protein